MRGCLGVTVYLGHRSASRCLVAPWCLIQVALVNPFWSRNSHSPAIQRALIFLRASNKTTNC